MLVRAHEIRVVGIYAICGCVGIHFTSDDAAIDQVYLRILLEEACRSAERARRGGFETIVVDFTVSEMSNSTPGICDAPSCAVCVVRWDCGKSQHEAIDLIEGSDSMPA